MRVVIHQAYLAPWLGYFSKLFFADAFVVLDDVNFRKRHYFDRTRIVDMHGDIRWIGVPVGENHLCKCSNVSVRSHNFADKLLTTIRQSYPHARHYDQEISDVVSALDSPLRNLDFLVEMDIQIIKNLSRLLDLKAPQIFYASSLRHEQDRTIGLIEICKQIGATSLIIGTGKSLQVHDWSKIQKACIQIYVQDYLEKHPVYPQTHRRQRGFVKGLSIIDAILNTGRHKTLEFLCDEKYMPKELTYA